MFERTADSTFEIPLTTAGKTIRGQKHFQTSAKAKTPRASTQSMSSSAIPAAERLNVQHGDTESRKTRAGRRNSQRLSGFEPEAGSYR